MSVRVKILVLENDEEVGAIHIGYFDGQDYQVRLVTPDGLDAEVSRKAGEVKV